MDVCARRTVEDFLEFSPEPPHAEAGDFLFLLKSAIPHERVIGSDQAALRILGEEQHVRQVVEDLVELASAPERGQPPF